LWCLQEALDVRKDVKIVNLSLANAKWYIKQIQSNLGIDLGWTDSQIDYLPLFGTRDGTTFRLQDLVIDAIIVNNYGKIPIAFSVTVPSGSRKFRGRSVDSRLVLHGLAWHLRDSGDKIDVDAESSYAFFTNPEKFRTSGLIDSTIYKDETIRRLSGNYANSMLMVAEKLRREGKLKKAEELIRKTIRLVPHFYKALGDLANILATQENLSELRALVDTTTGGDRAWMNTLLARLEMAKGDPARGERLLNAVLVQNPSFRPALDELIHYYYEQNNVPGMKVLLQRWLQFNPDDNKIRSLLMELQQRPQAGKRKAGS
jgi:Tfp pilus assembly protein PilF